MKALLLKDFFTIKNQLNWIAAILLFFLVITFISGDSMVLLTLGIVFGTVQVSSLFTYDEMSRWNQFVNTLPVKREQIILSKYLLTIFLSVGIIILISIIFTIQNVINLQYTFNEAIAIFCIILFLTSLFSCITIPLYVKFGPQKGRIAMYFVIFFPIGVITFIKDEVEKLVSQLPSIETLYKIAYSLPLLSCILFIISYYLSVSFYKKKEF